MPVSNKGIYENPAKSPYNFERYDSDLERLLMAKLEADAQVVKWQKRHGISIRWIDPHGRQCNYRPDFLVEYADGSKKLIEVKGLALMDSPSVMRKRRAAEEWCRHRAMQYEIATMETRTAP